MLLERVADHQNPEPSTFLQFFLPELAASPELHLLRPRAGGMVAITDLAPFMGSC